MPQPVGPQKRHPACHSSCPRTVAFSQPSQQRVQGPHERVAPGAMIGMIVEPTPRRRVRADLIANDNKAASDAGGATRPLVSIVVPLLNEASGLETFRKQLRVAIERCNDVDFEVVCVDDGSTDDTLARLLAIAADDPCFRVVELSRNFGKEAALTAGMDEAVGDAVVPIDADLQDPPELIPRMIEAWRAGAEVVLGRRVDRSSDSAAKRVTARWFYRLHNRLSPVAIPENVGDFRLMDRVVVDALKRLPERQRFMKGLFAWLGFRTVTVDYTRLPRAAGKSRFSGWRLWNFAIEGITSFSTAPLRLWTYVGLASAALSVAYAAFMVMRTLVLGVDVPGYASLIVLILLLGGLQLVSLGILGEYIGRIYVEAKARPLYVVRRYHGGADAELAAKRRHHQPPERS